MEAHRRMIAGHWGIHPGCVSSSPKMRGLCRICSAKTAPVGLQLRRNGYSATRVALHIPVRCVRMQSLFVIMNA